MRKDMIKLAGEMNVKLSELAERDGPHERSYPPGTRFTIYHPGAASEAMLAKSEWAIDWLQQRFEYGSRIDFREAKYQRTGNSTTLTVTIPPQSNAMAIETLK